MAVIWEKAQQSFLTLFDIDREFQNAHEAYEQWQARHRRKRSAWACLGVKSQDDALGKVLSLGREVRRVMDTGKELYGSRFEQGDSMFDGVMLFDGRLLTEHSNMPNHTQCTTSPGAVRDQATPGRHCATHGTHFITL
jgi:hypothetical protein